MNADYHIAKARATKLEDRVTRQVQAFFAGERAIAEGTAARCPFDPVSESDLHEQWTWYVNMRRRGGRPTMPPETESEAYKELFGGGA